LPKAPVSTQPLVPPQRASTSDLPWVQQFLDYRFNIKNRWLAPAFANYFPGLADKKIGVLFADLHIGAGLQQPHLVNYFKQQVSKVVYTVPAVRFEGRPS
jgi:hypothetical protein